MSEIKTQTNDIFERIKTNMGPLGQYADMAEGYYIFPRLEGPLSNRMIFQGKEIINWSINDYLGLGRRKDVIEEDYNNAKEFGMAYPMGSRMMSGDTRWHEELEIELASFVNKESAVLVNFGYQGIMSAIDAILSRRDVVIYDANCHACIVDGVRMHSGKRFTFKHNDMESLEKYLRTAGKLVDETGGGILVISEGVFGMQGDQGRLKDILALKQKYDFRFLCDDAHGFGTLGQTGAGTGEEQGVQDQIDIYFSTFAKAMGCIGAFLAGDAEIIKFLKYNMRSQIFAKSMPYIQVKGNLKRLELLKTDKSLKENLWKNVNMLQSGLRNAGFNLGQTNSCVTPVFLNGTVNEATNLVHDLRENHRIFCSMVIYPVVPKGIILLRLIPTAAHTNEDIDETITAFLQIKDKLHSGFYKGT